MNNITFLYPGQLKVGQNGEILKTVLGSCVSVVFWDSSKGIGGMCHYLLVDAPKNSAPSGRYGSFAIKMLYDQMLDMGANRSKILASVFGGGAVVDALSSSGGGIGDRNVEYALEFLKNHSVKIKEQKVGGTSGRRIAFDVTSGEVLCDAEHADKVARAGVITAAPKALTRVLIVDDSATLRTILAKVFDRSKKISVVGTATDPFDARDKIIQLKPDVITLDIEMPRMNGIQFLEKLMLHQPMPVVVVSSLSAQGSAAEKALELGAIEFVHKPSQFDPTILTDLGETLIPKVIGAASIDVKNLKRSASSAPKPKSVSSSPQSTATPRSTGSMSGLSGGVHLVGIGGNGGCSDPLISVLSGLPTDTPPVVVAVSTIAGFAEAWIQKHKGKFKIPVEVGKAGKTLQSGVAYIWAEDQHVKVVGSAGQYKLEAYKAAPVSGQRPSADILFESIAKVCGAQGIATLLSGYGKDGVAGMGMLRDAGGWTICQDPSDCAFNFNVVAALEAGVSVEAANRGDIAEMIYQRRSNIVLAAS